MIVKFCYQNEIHRCSEPPGNFEELPSFLKSMFRTTLPTEFDLFYVNSNKENIPLLSSQDYEVLKDIDSQKPLKIVIVEKEAPKEQQNKPIVEESRPKADSSEYEVIQQSSEPEQVQIPQVKEEEQPLLQDSAQVDEESKLQPQAPEQVKEEYDGIVEKISENFANEHVLPRLGELQSDPSTQENVRKIVRETLKEQIPYIISQVKDSFIREGLISVPHSNVYYYGQNQPMRAPQHNWNRMGYQPYQNLENRQQPQNIRPQQLEQVDLRPQSEENDFIGSMLKTLSAIPNKAIEVVDNLAQKIEGDPYVMLNEGKYTRSTFDKVEKLREIFPEEQRKVLLDFVQDLPRAMPIDQIADLFVSRENTV